MSFIATIYEDFARLRCGMRSAKFKTPYTTIVCPSFEDTRSFMELAESMGLSCAICSREHIKKYNTYAFTVFVTSQVHSNSVSFSEILAEHCIHTKQKH